MKKLLTLLLALMMVLSLSACSKDAGNSNTAVSGTFEGESTGMQGPVKVSMTVEEGKINKYRYEFYIRTLEEILKGRKY